LARRQYAIHPNGKSTSGAAPIFRTEMDEGRRSDWDHERGLSDDLEPRQRLRLVLTAKFHAQARPKSWELMSVLLWDQFVLIPRKQPWQGQHTQRDNDCDIIRNGLSIATFRSRFHRRPPKVSIGAAITCLAESPFLIMS